MAPPKSVRRSPARPQPISARSRAPSRPTRSRPVIGNEGIRVPLGCESVRDRAEQRAVRKACHRVAGARRRRSRRFDVLFRAATGAQGRLGVLRDDALYAALRRGARRQIARRGDRAADLRPAPPGARGGRLHRREISDQQAVAPLQRHRVQGAGWHRGGRPRCSSAARENILALRPRRTGAIQSIQAARRCASVVGLSGNLGFTHDPRTVFEAARVLRNEANIHFMLSGWGVGWTCSRTFRRPKGCPT